MRGRGVPPGDDARRPSVAFGRRLDRRDGQLRSPRLTRPHLELRQLLLPLLQVEEAPIHRLTPLGSQEIELDGKPLSNQYWNKEVSVTAGSAWKSALRRMLNHGGSADGDRPPSGDWDDPNAPGRVMFQCREDMLRLWFDPVVQALLRAQRFRLQEMPGL